MMSPRPRILGLDVGDKRIGIAISDPLGITAAGLEALTRSNTQADLAHIAKIAETHRAAQIVIGLPLNMDGTAGQQAEKTRAFGRKLARLTGLPIVYEDERLSTVSAIRTLTLQGVKTGQRRELIDKQAAAIILQKFLNRHVPPPSA